MALYKMAQNGVRIMAAFDIPTRAIRDDSWDKGEEVVIKELTFSESSKLNIGMLDEMTIGETEDEETRKQLKVGRFNFERQQVDKMNACIVSWTFKQNGKAIPVNIESIRMLGASYGDFIQKEIEVMNPTRDEKFQTKSGAGDEGQGKTAS